MAGAGVGAELGRIEGLWEEGGGQKVAGADEKVRSSFVVGLGTEIISFWNS